MAANSVCQYVCMLCALILCLTMFVNAQLRSINMALGTKKPLETYCFKGFGSFLRLTLSNYVLRCLTVYGGDGGSAHGLTST